MRGMVPHMTRAAKTPFGVLPAALTARMNRR